jgi:hypothetical protein
MNGITQAQVENAKNLACEKCNSQIMKQTFVVKMISGLITGDSKDTLVPVPFFACAICNHVNSMFAKDLNLVQDSKEVPHVQV